VIPPRSTLAFLRHRWYVAMVLVAFLALFAFLAQGAVQDGRDRRAARARIEGLATKIADQNETLLEVSTAIRNATSPEAQARQAQALAGTITDVRRSIDCAALDTQGVHPPPCVDVDGRLDALRSGLDPFARPPSPSTGGTP